MSQSKIQPAADRVEAAIHDLSHSLRRTSHKAEDAVTDTIEALAKSAQKLLDELRQPTAAIRKNAVGRIEEHPTAVAGLAAAALALAGLLLHHAGKGED